MKRFYRFAAALLALIMIAGSAMAAGTIIHRQDYDNGDSFSISSLVYNNDTLYMCDYGNELRTYSFADGTINKWYLPDDIVKFEDDDENYSSFHALLGGDDGVYALFEVANNSEDGYSFDHMRLYRVEISDGQPVFSDEYYELEWDELVEEYDDYSFANNLRFAYIENGKIIGMSYNDTYDTVIAVIDIEEDEMELIMANDVVSICPYSDGKVLAVTHDYSSEDAVTKVEEIDLATAEYTTKMEVNVSDYNYPSNVAYDADDDILYYVLNGELVGVPGFDPAAAYKLGAAGIDSWGNIIAVVTKDNYYVCADYESVMMYNTDPSAVSETTMYVYGGYNQAMENAYYSFTAANPGVDVVQLTSYEDITQAMLTQSSAVDIYTIDVSYQDFDAVFNRGYMVELDDSSIITDYVYSTYPAIQNVLVHDGHVVAVPVYSYASTLSYNQPAFEALGIADKVPTTWVEFVQLIQELPSILGEDSGYTLFDPYYTVYDVRNMLYYTVIDNYMLYLQQDGVEFSFNTPELRDVLSLIDATDFTQLGHSDEYNEDMEYVWDHEKILFNTYGSVSCETYVVRDATARPMPLAFGDGQALVPCYVTVAFINPYSENRDLAIEYLEYAVSNMPNDVRIKLCPGFNEPQENYYYEENLASYEESIASAIEQRDAAEDDETREMWQNQIDDLTMWRDEYEEYNRWDISEESIAYYRSYADMLCPYEFIGFDNEASNELYTLMNMVIDGTMDLDSFLEEVDGKIRMMILEDM